MRAKCLTTVATAVFFFFAVPVLTIAQMLDLNGNGISDVWEWVYSATNINPNADSDGDGFSNLQEAIAGTNPFDRNSYPKILGATISGTNGTINIPAQLGKLYQLQSVTNLANLNWLTETSAVDRTGTNFSFPSPAASTMKFYRVLVSDVDSDGDGLNDWEEYQLGLNPTNAQSNGTMDGNGQAMNDYQFATNKFASQNVITISATDPVTVQPDPGGSATDLGQFTVTRGGFPLNLTTVGLQLGGPGAGFAASGKDYLPLSTLVSFAAGTSIKTISVVPLANTNLQTPVIVQLKLLPGNGYTVGSQSNASIVIYPSPTANGQGLFAQYFTNSSITYTSTNNFNPTNLFLTRVDPVIDFNFTNGTVPDLSNGLYSVRWTGQIEPQYSETYFFDVRSDDGCKLWVNDQLIIDKWQSQGVTDWTNAIPLQGGTRYDIRLEYYQGGGKGEVHLYWYSPSQSKQIIPNNRMYPTNSFGGGTSNAPAVITSALSAIGFVGQPFNFNVTGANTPLGFAATGLPPGLSFNTTNGLINGTPLVAGSYSVTLTTSNMVGVGASILNIQVIDTGSSIVREVWTNIPGINISDIPLTNAPNSIAAYGGLEGITDFGDNYGERIRGYFTAPITGNYYFWAAGSDSVQLWISDDSEAVNKVLRCWVTPTNNPTASGTNGTSPRQWSLQSSQRSPWLTLLAGQRYYIELLHKAGTGSGDNWSVGWLQNPAGTNTTPAGVVTNYLLSRYYAPLPANIPGTLYTATMLALPGVSSSAVGSATLRVSADGTQAVLNYSVSGISGTHVDHIYSDPYLNYPSQLLFDIAAAKPQPDGSYLWSIKPTGAITNAADILEIIAENKCSIVIQTVANPAGEIGGHFTLANGSQTFTPPPAPPAWIDDHTDPNAAVRFLSQVAFGANSNDIATVQSLGYDGWISNQFLLPATHHLPLVQLNKGSDPTAPYPSTDWFNTWWQNSITAPDQLRQRVAFALSEILVVSENGTLQNDGDALSYYYDTLLDNAFGNFRTLLEAATLTPAMGVYLNMQGNDKGSIITGLHANENYAREINQLFSVGLYHLWPDGSLILNSQGNLVPTYSQDVVSGFAATFTGWNYYQTNQANGRLPISFGPPINWTNPMVLVPAHHDLGTKLLLDNVVLPPAWGPQADSTQTNYDYYGLQDLEKAHDNIFNNQNVGPFICRQLIQRLVTSNPSRDYVYRVVQKFNDNGNGVRGDMQAVIKAILLDYEARSTNFITSPTYGKQREPLLRVTAIARAFPSPPTVTGTYSQTGTRTISITTAAPHRVGTNDTVYLTFTDTSGNPAPANADYSATITSPTTFTVNAGQVLSGSYGQTNGVLTVSISNHGTVTNIPVYLIFTSGGASNGIYQVASVIDTAHFTTGTTDAVQRTGSCLLLKLSVGGYTQSGTNITISTTGAHALLAGDTVYINFTSGSAVDGLYTILTVPDSLHFTIGATNSANQNQNSLSIYPQVPPHWTGSGNVIVQESTWNMGYTDTGTSSSLSQSPLRAPTVFNFYYPNYEFPGALAAAGLTTPEFQLTSDTGVALLMNFLEGGILNNTGNTNGLSSFTSGNGSIVLDLSPWMTSNYTSQTGISNLVENFNTMFVAGQLSAAAKTNIINFVTNTVNFPGPTNQAQMRDRVRAVLHLIVNSPDCAIQK